MGLADGSVELTRLPFTVSSAMVAKTFRRVNLRKSADPLKSSLDGSSEPAHLYWLMSLQIYSICPFHNDFQPIALIPILMKCFERIVMSHIQTFILDTLDSLHFAYRQNRSTEDAMSTTKHTAFTHLENKDSYV